MQKSTLPTEIENLLNEADRAIGDTKAYLISQGEVVNLEEWLTIKEYCNKFNVKNVETVVNWISRGIVPADHVRVVKEFNNIRLIKAVTYSKPAKSAV
jgi:hypothetical protein